MLTAMTYLFSLANENKTLQQLTDRMVMFVHGKPFLLPLMFFGMSVLLSAAGPGNIAAVALLAPIGMMMAYQTKQSLLLMAIMICTGANAGAFSPIAPTGVVAAGILQQINMNQANLPLGYFSCCGSNSVDHCNCSFYCVYYCDQKRTIDRCGKSYANRPGAAAFAAKSGADTALPAPDVVVHPGA